MQFLQCIAQLLWQRVHVARICRRHRQDHDPQESTGCGLGANMSDLEQCADSLVADNIAESPRVAVLLWNYGDQYR